MAFFPIEEFHTPEVTWIHVFRSMIETGALKAMSGSVLKVYLVVKSHANIRTGSSWPSYLTIAEKSGLSESQVKRAIRELERQGYVVCKKVGRRNHYTLCEKIRILDEAGEVKALAKWHYRPEFARDELRELKRQLESGSTFASTVFQFENLQVNINNFNMNKQEAQWADVLSDLPPKIQGMLKDMLQRRKTSMPES